MNIVALTGRITRDLKLYQSNASKKPFVFFTVAVSTIPTKSDFIPCVAWDKIAENMVKFVGKGSLISLSGRISTRKTVVEGKDQYITEVVAQSVTFLDRRKSSNDSIDIDYNNNHEPQEAKINLDDAFKNVNYSTNIDFNPNTPTSAPDNSPLTDEETIIWDD